VPSIQLSTTAPIADPAVGGPSIDALAMGAARAENPIYARLFNPTVDRFEQALADLEGTTDAVSFGSGMAAISAVLLAAAERGRHVIAVRPVYGGTDHLLSTEPFGLNVTFAKATEVAAAIRPDTALILCETPANPTLDLVDLERLVADAGDVPVAVDSTFATPVLQTPADFGVALVIHSATKFIGGHGDVLAGVVACNGEHAASLRRVRIMTGGVLHPMGGYLLHRGLQTLPARVRLQQKTARTLVGRLMEHALVTDLRYPGLDDPTNIVGRQMRGTGSLLAFDVGSLARAEAVMRSVRLCTPAVSLGTVDTLIQHPAGLTHRVVDPVARAEHGITEGLLRVSVGLESAEDLWTDLRMALDQAALID
jgi:cystathionine beta-lyase/cystathionine gamma-synthase